jgi:hypothetical protein
MNASGLAAVKASPLAEIPAAALRIAAGFATARVEGLDAVVIKPGQAEGEVIITAAQQYRAVQLTVQGSCKSQIGLPVLALRGALRRDSEAEHVVIVEAGDAAQVSVRTFSPSCTVAVAMPECVGAALNLPPTTPGPCRVNFDTTLMACLLRDLQPLMHVALEPFSKGMAISGQGDGFSVFALLAGIENGPEHSTTNAQYRALHSAKICSNQRQRKNPAANRESE